MLVLIFVSCKSLSPAKPERGNELSPYTSFLKHQNTSATDYIFELFKKYDIVILCERDHAEITQYDLILNIIKDTRFSKMVKNVYNEIGNSAYNDTLNKFLHQRELSDEQLAENILMMQRYIFPTLWEKSTYGYYLAGIYDINKRTAGLDKISAYGLDYPVRWETATQSDIDMFIPLTNMRDSLMADNFKRIYLKSNSNKALVIMNSRHALVTDFARKNFGAYIASAFKGKVANVLLNTISLKSTNVTDRNVPDIAFSSPQDGKWEASFIAAGKDDLGFSFSGTTFGKDSFDLLPLKNNFTYADMFNGFIYYKHLPDWKRVYGLENLVDKEFEAELIRRLTLENNFQKINYQVSKTPEQSAKDLFYFAKKHEESYKDALPEAVKEVEKWLK